MRVWQVLGPKGARGAILPPEGRVSPAHRRRVAAGLETADRRQSWALKDPPPPRPGAEYLSPGYGVSVYDHAPFGTAPCTAFRLHRHTFSVGRRSATGGGGQSSGKGPTQCTRPSVAFNRSVQRGPKSPPPPPLVAPPCGPRQVRGSTGPRPSRTRDPPGLPADHSASAAPTFPQNPKCPTMQRTTDG